MREVYQLGIDLTNKADEIRSSLVWVKETPIHSETLKTQISEMEAVLSKLKALNDLG